MSFTLVTFVGVEVGIAVGVNVGVGDGAKVGVGVGATVGFGDKVGDEIKKVSVVYPYQGFVNPVFSTR